MEMMEKMWMEEGVGVGVGVRISASLLGGEDFWGDILLSEDVDVVELVEGEERKGMRNEEVKKKGEREEMEGE